MIAKYYDSNGVEHYGSNTVDLNRYNTVYEWYFAFCQ